MFRIFGRCSACLVLGCRKCSFDLVSLFGLCGGGGARSSLASSFVGGRMVDFILSSSWSFSLGQISIKAT